MDQHVRARKYSLIFMILLLSFSGLSQSPSPCIGVYIGREVTYETIQSMRDTLTSLGVRFADSICSDQPLIAEFEEFPALKNLAIYGPLVGISSSIGAFSKLQVLSITRAKLLVLPEEVGDLKELEKISLTRCSDLTTLPERIGELANLKYINCNDSKIDSFPSSFVDLDSLEELYFTSSTMETFPMELIDCGSRFLRIELSLPKLKTLPADVKRMKFRGLSRQLVIRDCKSLTSLPNNIRREGCALSLIGASNLMSIAGLNEGTERFELLLRGLSSRRQLRKLLRSLDSGEKLTLFFSDREFFKVIPRKLYHLDGLLRLKIYGMTELKSENWVKRKRKKIQRKLPRTQVYFF